MDEELAKAIAIMFVVFVVCVVLIMLIGPRVFGM